MSDGGLVVVRAPYDPKVRRGGAAHRTRVHLAWAEDVDGDGLYQPICGRPPRVPLSGLYRSWRTVPAERRCQLCAEAVKL